MNSQRKNGISKESNSVDEKDDDEDHMTPLQLPQRLNSESSEPPHELLAGTAVLGGVKQETGHRRCK